MAYVGVTSRFKMIRNKNTAYNRENKFSQQNWKSNLFVETIGERPIT